MRMIYKGQVEEVSLLLITQINKIVKRSHL